MSKQDKKIIEARNIDKIKSEGIKRIFPIIPDITI